MAGKVPETNPVRVAVTVSLMIAIFVVAIGISIGGAYYFANANHTDSNRKQTQVELKSAKGECEALNTLAQSGNGITFNKPGPSETVLIRMLNGVREVFLKSDCPAILAGKIPPDLKSGS